MKNRNGFTLIELLVTIAIMALILIMIMPAIKSLQETNKKKEYGYYKDSLIEAAKLYVTKEGEDINSSGYVNWKGCVDITYNDLIVADLIKPFQDENIDCSNSMIRYTKNNKKTKYTYKVVCIDKTGKEVYNENTLETEEECEVVNTDDKTPPECGSSIGENTEWTKENVTITMNCTDTESGCKSVTKTFNKTTKIDYIEIEDGNGNKNTCPVNVYIDKKGPNCTSSGGSNSWTQNAVTLTGTCSDEESGCVSNITKKYDSEGNWINQSPGVVKDKLGNETTCPANQTVRIDRTYPSVRFECVKNPPENPQARTLVRAYVTDNLSGYNCFTAVWSSERETICRGGLTNSTERFYMPQSYGVATFTSLCDVAGNCIPSQLSYGC